MSFENGDILRSLPINKWPLLRDVLKQDWPKFSHYYFLVDNAIKWKEKDPSWECEYLCPEGNPNAGVFLAISTLPVYNVIPFAFKESKQLLFECLTKTKCIDWSRNVMLRAVHEYFEDTVRKAAEYLVESKDLVWYDTGSSKNYIKYKEQCARIEIKIPDDVELRFLNESHVALIYEVWPREEFKRNPEASRKYLSTIIRLNRGVGLFGKTDGKLVSWALQNDWAGLGMIQTLDEFRGRGYAKIVIDALAKMLADLGLDSTLMIVRGNKAAEGMFTSMNWRVTNSQMYIKLRPKDRSE